MLPQLPPAQLTLTGNVRRLLPCLYTFPTYRPIQDVRKILSNLNVFLGVSRVWR